MIFLLRLYDSINIVEMIDGKFSDCERELYYIK